ncbi:MAG: tetratricopeptide repeat protein [Alphaproteobacteria bacterium]|nr:tetratricopeptide repeat protein [Alphaproteobacteria bacterium]
MSKSFIFLIKVLLLLIPALWLAFYPGELKISWYEWQIETSVAVLVLFGFVATVLVIVLNRLARIVFDKPLRWWRSLNEKRLRAVVAFSDGLIYAESGDLSGLQRAAKLASLIPETRTSGMYLSARRNELQKNFGEARSLYEVVVLDSRLSLLARQGLARIALAEHQPQLALAQAEQARLVAPNALWVNQLLVELYEKNHDWAKLWQILEGKSELAGFSAKLIARKQAIVQLALMSQAEAAGRTEEALTLAKSALESQPSFVPAISALARLLIAGGNLKAAERLIEKHWHQAQHPEIALLYRATAPDSSELAQVMRFRALEKRAPESPETDFALGTISKTAELWGEARRYWRRAVERDPGYQARVYNALAALEIAEHDDHSTAETWIKKSREAGSLPLWRCHQCLQVADFWTPSCLHCGAVDRIEWGN